MSLDTCITDKSDIHAFTSFRVRRRCIRVREGCA
jgi:hypothetical protein